MNPPLPSLRPRAARQNAFTIMEILVVVAIILVLAAIAVPVYSSIQMRGSKAVAVNNMKQITTAMTAFAGQNDGTLPDEDAKGTDTWETAAKPESAKVWYNALPRLLGSKGVGDYAATPRDFYTKMNLLFLPGALYPETDKKLVQPLFAFAVNTKLHRKDEEGKKGPLKLSQITNPSRTVAFLEQGIRGEKPAMPQQPKYDGSCKGSAKSFVARYGGKGVLTFLDGHAESVEAHEILTETGIFPFPQTDIVWTRTPEEDPNK